MLTLTAETVDRQIAAASKADLREAIFAAASANANAFEFPPANATKGDLRNAAALIRDVLADRELAVRELAAVERARTVAFESYDPRIVSARIAVGDGLANEELAARRDLDAFDEYYRTHGPTHAMRWRGAEAIAAEERLRVIARIRVGFDRLVDSPVAEQIAELRDRANRAIEGTLESTRYGQTSTCPISNVLATASFAAEQYAARLLRSIADRFAADVAGATASAARLWVR